MCLGISSTGEDTTSLIVSSNTDSVSSADRLSETSRNFIYCLCMLSTDAGSKNGTREIKDWHSIQSSR